MPAPPYSSSTVMPSKSERAELRPQIARERIVAVDLGGARRDLGCGEGAHAVAQHVDLGAEIEIEHGVAIGWHHILRRDAIGEFYRPRCAAQGMGGGRSSYNGAWSERTTCLGATPCE